MGKHNNDTKEHPRTTAIVRAATAPVPQAPTCRIVVPPKLVAIAAEWYWNPSRRFTASFRGLDRAGCHSTNNSNNKAANDTARKADEVVGAFHTQFSRRFSSFGAQTGEGDAANPLEWLRSTFLNGFHTFFFQLRDDLQESYASALILYSLHIAQSEGLQLGPRSHPPSEGDATTSLEEENFKAFVLRLYSAELLFFLGPRLQMVLAARSSTGAAAAASEGPETLTAFWRKHCCADKAPPQQAPQQPRQGVAAHIPSVGMRGRAKCPARGRGRGGRGCASPAALSSGGDSDVAFLLRSTHSQAAVRGGRKAAATALRCSRGPVKGRKLPCRAKRQRSVSSTSTSSDESSSSHSSSDSSSTSTSSASDVGPTKVPQHAGEELVRWVLQASAPTNCKKKRCTVTVIPVALASALPKSGSKKQ